MTEDNRNITPRTDSSISRRQEDLINRGLELARKINSPDQNKPAEYKYEFVRKWGSEGSEDGQFDTPAGVALDGDGNVYVTDTRNHRIQVFNSEGNFLRKWESRGSEDGQFDRPYGLAIGSDGNVYVADTGYYRIQVFKPARLT